MGREQASASHPDLWFQDDANGFALIGSSLLKTQDGGGQWTTVSFGAEDFTPQSMSFVDAETGWVMGAVGTDEDALAVPANVGRRRKLAAPVL
jgi:photosystem II stability/assembly factor-like uncharacterized protein